MPYADKTKRRIYKAWKNMLSRCEDPLHAEYEAYGGRGINVCEEWHKFFPFYCWSLKNGYSDNLTIDRTNNDKGYSPDNCRWVSQKVNSRNRRNNHRVTFNGKTLCTSEWAENIGITPQALAERLTSKLWTLEEALTIGKNGRPTQQPSFKKAIVQMSRGGEMIKKWESISDASNSLNIPSSNISRALKNPQYTARGFYWKYHN